MGSTQQDGTGRDPGSTGDGGGTSRRSDRPGNADGQPGDRTDGQPGSRTDDRPSGRTDDRPDLPAETPPGPDGWPLLGNTLQFARDPFTFYEEELAPHGDVVSWSLAGFDFVSVLDPEEIERVLVTEHEVYDKTLFGDRGVDFAPDGLVFSEGEQWRAQRSLLQDVFTLDRIRRYGERMVDVAEARVADWPEGEPIALNERFADLTLDVLSRTLLDVELDAERGDTVAEFADAFNARADATTLANFLPKWIPTPTHRRWQRAEAEFDAMLDDLIAERRAADGGSSAGADGLEDRDDLLSVLLHAEGPDGYRHAERELRDQLETFLFAGHDTTSLALTYTCLLLGQDDDALHRLRAEWDDVLGDGQPTPADVPRLEFTDRVLTEALRLYPPTLIVLRETGRDVELGGYRIPEGTKVSLPQFHVHTDERFYDDPEAFDPDRWTEEFEDELHEYAYFPFGGGPRHCIGMRFARMELKLVLPTVLREHDVELLSDPDPEVSAGATAHPKEDVVVRLHPRG